MIDWSDGIPAFDWDRWKFQLLYGDLIREMVREQRRRQDLPIRVMVTVA